MTPSVRSGSWLAVSADDVWALVELPESDPRGPAVVAAARSADLDALLDALCSTGLSQTPAFAIAGRAGGQLRYLVRGGGTLTLIGADSSQLISGHAAPSWVDALAGPDVTGVRLTGGGVGEPTEFAPLMRAGELEIDLRAAPAEAASAQPAPSHAAPAAPSPPLAHSLYDDLLTANTTTREALAESLLAQHSDAELWGPTPTGTSPAVSEPVAETFEPAASGQTATWQGTSTWYPPAVTAPDPPVPEAPPTAPAVSAPGIIAALPWLTSPGTTDEAAPVAPPTAPVPPAFPVPPPAPRASPVPPPAPPVPTAAAVRPLAPTTPAVQLPPPPGQQLAEADGATRKRADIIATLAHPEPVGPLVYALLCSNRHWSPPYAHICRSCGVPLAEQEPQQISRPVLGRLVLSTGGSVTLDRGVVFGRSPKSDAVGGDRPNLIKLESNEISRQHAEIRLAGWQPMVRDLGSGNGTTVMLPGRPAEMIRPGEDYALEPGTQIGIADIVTITYEVV